MSERYQPRVHIRDPKFQSRALCGLPWVDVVRGGRVASNHEQPVVKNDETGSAHQATCRKCLELHRAALKR